MRQLILVLLLVFTRALAQDISNLKLFSGTSVECRDCQYSPDGSTFAIAGDDIDLFEVISRKPLRRLPCEWVPVAIEFSQDSRNLAAILMKPQTDREVVDHKLIMYNLKTGKRVIECKLPISSFLNDYELKVSPDAKRFAVADKVVKVVDRKGNLIWTWLPDKTEIDQPSGGFSATKDWKYFMRNLQRVSYPSGETTKPISLSSKFKGVQSSIITDDGVWAASVVGGYGSYELKCINLDSGAEKMSCKGSQVSRMTAMDGLDLIITDKAMYRSNKLVMVKERINSENTTEHYTGLAVSQKNGEFTIGTNYYQLPESSITSDTLSLAGTWYTPNKNTVKFGRKQQQLILRQLPWDPKGFDMKENAFFNPTSKHDYEYVVHNSHIGINLKGQLVYLDKAGMPTVDYIPAEARTNLYHPEGYTPVALNGDDIVAFGSIISLKAYVYDARNGKMINNFPIDSLNEMSYISMAISPDSKYLSPQIRHSDGKIYTHVIDVKTGKELLPKTFYQSRLFTEPGRMFLQNSTYLRWLGKTIEVLDTETWKVRYTIALKTGWITSITASFDGKQVLVNNGYNTGLIYNVETGQFFGTIIAAGKDAFIMYDKDGKVIRKVGDVKSLFQ